MDSGLDVSSDDASDAGSDASDAASYVDAGCPWANSLDFLSTCGNVPPLCLQTNGTAACGSGGTCSTGLPMMCNRPSDCAADASSCCAATASVGSGCPLDAILDASAGYAIRCRAGCTSPEVEVCMADSDCPNGTKCTAALLDYGGTKAWHVGICQ